ncbi:MAG: cation-translocating P-type ATPase, partial [Gammaproteobacteria bacterium]|nr:cation-translocating P-type ATPase [Gammaproteobacteria bacterium]
SSILEAIRDVGYVPHPYSVHNDHAMAVAERHRQLRRLGIAGLLGMQVMTLSVALYAGQWYGMEAEFRTFFRWVSLALATPIVLYAAQPFFAAAWRDVTRAAPGMDVPVALGIGLAFLASVRATFNDVGEVYFDSVAMFTFLLLAARYLEFTVRRSALDAVARLVAATPETALQWRSDARLERVPALELVADDIVLVRPGDTVPADGLIIEGQSSVDESLLSGESTPVHKRVGETLLAGTANVSSPLRMRVQKCGKHTQLSAIVRLTNRAQQDRPRSVRTADRVAMWFVGGVLLLTALVGSYWYSRGEPAWLDIVLALLVVSCPCALSLATPSAITATLSRLLLTNVLVTRSSALETLANASHFVFDKTGTLTSSRPALAEVQTLADRSAQECRRIASALECHSTHPLADALRLGYETAAAATNVSAESDGLAGDVRGTRFWLGSADFVARHTGNIAGPLATPGDSGSIVYLSDAQNVLAMLVFRDVVREQAQAVVTDLRNRNKQVWLLTGDNGVAAKRVAQQLGIDHVEWKLTPRDKLDRVQKLQAQGATVAMIGDGVNDAPVLAQSQVSIAMGSGAGLAAAKADVVLLGDRLMDLRRSVTAALTTRRVIVQNLSWAVLYNLVAIPAAALGYVPPWLAAIGMSLSSLLVVGNAYRLKFARL